MNLPVVGQFDNADVFLNNEDLNKIMLNDVFDKSKNSDDNDEIDDKLDYLDYEDDLEYENSKSTLNIYNFEEKVDLTYKTKQRTKVFDKEDNATYDRVLDTRSRMIMYKMMRQKEFETVNGCFSAGKEANVYHAPSCTGEDLVLKVYMTSIMPFKKRQMYMRGDNRFQNVSLSSSTKVVTIWAEKEFRNLHRLYDTNGAIPCPRPIKQKGMVLLMSMIGSNGNGAPRLKDVSVEDNREWSDMYAQVVGYVRIMYQECHLIHGDLSEYNLLYHDKKVFVIDVSQSVEHEHPNAFVLLRNDCYNINIFFRGKQIPTLSLSEFFFFVIGINFCKHTDENFKLKVTEMIDSSTFSTNGEEEGYFKNCYIERYLGNVTGEQIHEQYKAILKNPDHVNELTFLKIANIADDMRNIRANKIKSIKHHKQTLRKKKEMLQNELDEDKSDEEIREEENSMGQEVKSETSNDDAQHNGLYYRPKKEDAESRKLRKKQIKEVQKEARVNNKQQLLEEKFRTISGFKYKNKLIK